MDSQPICKLCSFKVLSSRVNTELDRSFVNSISHILWPGIVCNILEIQSSDRHLNDSGVRIRADF
jgi:hypothetical protein